MAQAPETANGDDEPTDTGLVAWLDRHSKGLTAAAALLIPLTVAVAGAVVNSAVSDRELETRQLELAVSILAEPVGDDDENRQEALRTYAVDLLARSSPIAISDELRQQLVSGEVSLLSPEALAAIRDFGTTAQQPQFRNVTFGADQLGPECRLTVGPAVVDADGAAVEPGEYAVSSVTRTYVGLSGFGLSTVAETESGQAIRTSESAMLSNCDVPARLPQAPTLNRTPGPTP